MIGVLGLVGVAAHHAHFVDGEVARVRSALHVGDDDLFRRIHRGIPFGP
mgnify:CR=1 FL=1